MLNVLSDAAVAGKRADNGFKKTTWEEVALQVNAIRQRGGLKDVRSCKGRLNTLKTDRWKPIKELMAKSGSGWDDERHVVTLPERAWQELKELNTPRSKLLLSWRNRPYKLYHQLDALVSDTVADGRYALNPFAEAGPQLQGSQDQVGKNTKEDARFVQSDSSDDTDDDLNSTPSKPPQKRQRPTKQNELAERLDRLDERLVEIAKRDPETSLERAFAKLADVVEEYKLDEQEHGRIVDYFTDRPTRAIAFLAVPPAFLERSVRRIVKMEEDRENREEEDRAAKRSRTSRGTEFDRW
ncbi:hypothetical protein FFLO_00973 [Filobasidium floriforme]|uniref:Myb/SANT-like domain-containing protein n=1 Tax=Filobasidium floriforme TaxID=5210 RepID=A0A8K0NSW9_9TREE|nr:hypothetical protein FFLO_00973 [Filobasidium floriforme]